MPFDRATILSEADASARRQVAIYRAAGTFGLYGLTYRKFLASALRGAWQRAKDAAEDAAYEASLPPILADVAQRIREIEADAWYAPITSRGNDEYTRLMGEASLMRDAAREAALVARKIAAPDDQLVLSLGSLVPRSCIAAVAAPLT